MQALPIGLLVALLTSAADDSARDGIAVHPLVVAGADPSEARSLNPAFQLAVIEADFPVTPSEPVLQFIENHPEKSCAGEDACLASLAGAVNARAALLVTASVGRDKVTVNGRLVSRTGRVLRKVDATEHKRTGRPFADEVITAIKQVLPHLKESGLEVEPLIEQPVEPPVIAAAPVAPRPEVAAGGPPWKTIGLVTAGAGVAALGAGGVVALLARGDVERVRQGLDGQGRFENEDAAMMNASLRQRATLANGSMIAGAVLTAAGAGMFLLGPEAASKPAVAVTVLPGLTVVSLGHKF